MDPRIPRLEARVDRLDTKVEIVLTELRDMRVTVATKNDIGKLSQDLWQWKVQWTAISVAAIALIVGGIIGGLAWIKPEPAPATAIQVLPTPAPTIQVVPSPAPPVVIHLPPLSTPSASVPPSPSANPPP